MRRFVATGVDYLGTMFAGAVAGAGVGSVLPGLGTAAGFVVGGIAGLVSCRVARRMGYSPFSLEGNNAGEMARNTAVVVGSGLAGAGLGAGIGAAIGTFIFPGLGTAAGAIIGAVIGGAAGLVTGGAINKLASFFGWGKAPKNEASRNSPPPAPGRSDTVDPGVSSRNSIDHLQGFAQRGRDPSALQTRAASDQAYRAASTQRNSSSQASSPSVNPREGQDRPLN